jgi:TonB family protein
MNNLKFRIILSACLLLSVISSAYARNHAVALDLTNADRRFDSSLRDYMIWMRTALEMRWVPNSQKKLIAKIRFNVTVEGDVKNIQIIRTSGNDLFDQTAVTAIEAAGPFTHTPQPTELLIDATFDNESIKQTAVSDGPKISVPLPVANNLEVKSMSLPPSGADVSPPITPERSSDTSSYSDSVRSTG